MKAKHRVLAAGMAAAMTLSLAACGGSASTAEPTASSAVETVTPEATSEAASGDVTEVTWWTYFGDKNIGYLQNIIDDFNNSQNQYHVTIVYQGNQMECNAKLQSTEKENLPAMFSGAVEDVAMYANSSASRCRNMWMQTPRAGRSLMIHGMHCAAPTLTVKAIRSVTPSATAIRTFSTMRIC